MKRYPQNGYTDNPVSWQSSKLTCVIILCQSQIITITHQLFYTLKVLTNKSVSGTLSLFFRLAFDNICLRYWNSYVASSNKCIIIRPIHRAIHIFPHLLHINSGKFSCSLFLWQVTNRNIQQIGWQKPFHYFFSIYTVECITKKLSNLKQTSKLSYDGPTVCIKSLIYSFF